MHAALGDSMTKLVSRYVTGPSSAPACPYPIRSRAEDSHSTGFTTGAYSRQSSGASISPVSLMESCSSLELSGVRLELPSIQEPARAVQVVRNRRRTNSDEMTAARQTSPIRVQESALSALTGCELYKSILRSAQQGGTDAVDVNETVRKHGINFASYQFSWTDCHALCQLLDVCGDTVQRIVLRDCQSDSQHFHRVLLAMRKCSALEVLNLSGMGLTSKSMRVIGEVVRNNRSTLKCIVLDSNGIGNEGADLLASNLRQCSNLRKISLAHCGIALENIPAIKKMIHNCRNLFHLNLEKNNIDDRALAEMEYTLASCTLREVNFHGNRLTSSSAVSLSHVLYYSFALTVLNLSGDHLGNCGLAHLKKSLLTCSCLRRVYLNDVGITSSSLPVLATLVQSWPQLRVLELNGNHFSHASAKKQSVFLAALGKCKELTRLVLPAERSPDTRCLNSVCAISSEFAYRLLGVKWKRQAEVFLDGYLLLGPALSITYHTATEVVVER